MSPNKRGIASLAFGVALTIAPRLAIAASIIVRAREANSDVAMASIGVTLSKPKLIIDPRDDSWREEGFEPVDTRWTDQNGICAFSSLSPGRYALNVGAYLRETGARDEPSEPPDPLTEYFMADSPCWFAVTGPRMNIGIRSAEESRDAVVRFWRKQSVRFSIVDTNDHPLAKTKVGVEIVLPPEWRRIQRERHPPLGAPGSALWWEGQTADSDRWIVLWALNAQSQTTDDNGEVTLVVPKGEPTWIGFNRSDLLPRDIRNGSLGFAVRADVRPTPVASPPVRVVVPACSIEKPSLEGTVRGPSIRADHVMAVGDSMWVSAPLLRMPSKHDGFEGSFVFFGLLPGTYTLRVGEYRDREVTVAEQHIEFPGTPMTVDIPIPSTDR